MCRIDRHLPNLADRATRGGLLEISTSCFSLLIILLANGCSQFPSSKASATVTVGSIGFALTGSLANARAGHTATLLPNGKVFIGGGTAESLAIGDNNALVDTVELFDPTTGSFQIAG